MTIGGTEYSVLFHSKKFPCGPSVLRCDWSASFRPQYRIFPCIGTLRSSPERGRTSEAGTREPVRASILVILVAEYYHSCKLTATYVTRPLSGNALLLFIFCICLSKIMTIVRLAGSQLSLIEMTRKLELCPPFLPDTTPKEYYHTLLALTAIR